jgi:hypothetical protein
MLCFSDLLRHMEKLVSAVRAFHRTEVKLCSPQQKIRRNFFIYTFSTVSWEILIPNVRKAVRYPVIRSICAFFSKYA